MKLAPRIAVITLAAASLYSTSALLAQETASATPQLKVHEWGTFTVLQGSDGNVIEWYQSSENLIDLPAFVQQNFRVGTKSRTAQWAGSMDTVRMETPVLYFYPEKEMEVSVTAGFPNGRITEVFPPAVTTANGESYWKGHLLPPNSPELALVPAATNKPGRHYAAARKVPEAWLYRNGPARSAERNKRIDTVNISKEKAAPKPEPAKVEPIDHFIFYRGAGNTGRFQISVEATNEPGNFVVANFAEASIPKLLALRVKDGKTAWLTMENLKQAKFDPKVLTWQHRQTLQFPNATTTTGEAVPALRSTMVEALIKEGLTPAEAAAMVATWDDLWFTEPGIRVLALLPQSFADSMVPLKISPTPTELDRVFVARLEILTRDQEQSMMNLLTVKSGTNAIAKQALTDLQLGRFAAGGMERAITLMSFKMRHQFNDLGVK